MWMQAFGVDGGVGARGQPTFYQLPKIREVRRRPGCGRRVSKGTPIQVREGVLSRRTTTRDFPSCTTLFRRPSLLVRDLYVPSFPTPVSRPD